MSHPLRGYPALLARSGGLPTGHPDLAADARHPCRAPTGFFPPALRCSVRHTGLKGEPTVCIAYGDGHLFLGRGSAPARDRKHRRRRFELFVLFESRRRTRASQGFGPEPEGAREGSRAFAAGTLIANRGHPSFSARQLIS
jgi:hypothetical protein